MSNVPKFPRCFNCVQLRLNWEEQELGNPIYVCHLTKLTMTYDKPILVCTLFEKIKDKGIL